jgi:hypothetical protein
MPNPPVSCYPVMATTPAGRIVAGAYYSEGGRKEFQNFSGKYNVGDAVR